MTSKHQPVCISTSASPSRQGASLNSKLTSSIGAKFGMAFALILILGGALSAFSITQMKAINAGTTVVSEHWVDGTALSIEIRNTVHMIRRAQLSLPINAIMAEIKEKEVSIRTNEEKVKAALVSYKGVVDTSEEQALLDKIASAFADVLVINQKFIQFMNASEIKDEKQYTALNEAILKAMGGTEGAIGELIKFNEKGADETEIVNTELFKNSLKLTIIFSGIALLIGVVLAIYMTGQIKKPLTSAVNDLGAIGEGDLSVQIKHNRNDELGDLQESLVKMLASLHTVVRHVEQCAHNLNNVSSEIASANQELATRTEQSANNLRSTTSSMVELSESVTESSAASQNVNQLASDASDIAKRGGQAVAQVVSNMEEITKSSKKIAAIVDVIDGIAFQTNILALNAAVEAARAGENGRGFAVVATEVRNLSQRSAQAAKEIKTLINASVSNISSGFNLVHSAGSTMKEIVTSVESVSKIIAEITASSSGQAHDINEIRVAIEQLEKMTEQNAALVEESYATAEVLKTQADQLVSAIGRFHL
jgi:methyl-accepting chemotaxis protein